MRAPLEIFSEYCYRHRFEQKILPEAKVKCWPQVIQWGKIEERICRIQHHLQDIIEDPISGLDGSTNGFQQGAKWRCVFWRETLETIQENGYNSVSCIRGQFSSFEKTQLG